MTKKFQILILIGFIPIFANGCGNQLPAGSASASARQTCYSLGYNDIAIDFAYNAARADRDAGFTESQFIVNATAGCRGDFGGGCTENPNVGVSISFEECVFACAACITDVAADVWH